MKRNVNNRAGGGAPPAAAGARVMHDSDGGAAKSYDRVHASEQKPFGKLNLTVLASNSQNRFCVSIHRLVTKQTGRELEGRLQQVAQADLCGLHGVSLSLRAQGKNTGFFILNTLGRYGTAV